MSGIIKKYSFGKNRLSRSLMRGFDLTEEGSLVASGRVSVRHIFLGGLDGAENGLNWGRLSFKLQSEGDMALTLRAMASDDPVFIRSGTLTKIDDFLLDPDITADIKERFFSMAGGLEANGAKDVLLNGISGRYLYLWLSLEGGKNASISDLAVFNPVDNFTKTFPAVYRAENDFFSRYMSVFSSLYYELQETVDKLPSYLDPDYASVPALRLFCSWLGIETEGSLTDEDSLRRVVKAAPKLLAAKGTKSAIELVIKLFIDEPFYIVERNLLTKQQEDSNMYGSSPYDFSILINREADERLRTCLEFFINQFKPIRSRCRIVFFGRDSSLDSFTYLDFNGTVLQNQAGLLDGGQSLSGSSYLQ
ncbi:MAG: hypothetical protein GX025_07200 [Clostridiales bacterium]|nr:hypothetical protein [Clostridiales bacterium]